MPHTPSPPTPAPGPVNDGHRLAPAEVVTADAGLLRQAAQIALARALGRQAAAEAWRAQPDPTAKQES